MTKKDGKNVQDSRKKKGTAGRRDEVICPSIVGGQSGSDNQSSGVRVSGHDCDDPCHSGRTNPNQSRQQYNQPSLGKVLEQLTSIEDRYYTYVHAHQGRLEQRQQESKQAENEFRAEIEALKEQIRLLVSTNNQQAEQTT